MKLIKVRGIVIKEVKYKDNDKILTILTDKLGKISCLSRGAKKNNSPLLASSQLLVTSDFILYKGTTYYNLNSAEVVDTFYNIRTDYEKLEKAYELLKIINNLTIEDEVSTEILSLVLNTMYVLNKTDKDFKFIEAVFKLKFLCLLGFRPNVVSCTICNKKIQEDNESKVYLYNVSNNNMLCNSCYKQLKEQEKIEYVKLKEGVFFAICFVLGSDIKKIYSFELNKSILQDFEKYVERIYVSMF